MQRRRIFILLFSLILLLSGCKTAATAADSAPSEAKSEVKDDEDTKPGDTTAKKNKKKTGSDNKRSFAKRICGKYRYDTDDGRSFILNVISFGNNVYAFFQEGENEDGNFFDYSYFAAEFLPFDAKDMESADIDSARIKALFFSNMSNAGKYWGSGNEGTVTITDGGLSFEGFDNDGYLCREDGSSMLYKDYHGDEKVFIYEQNDPEGGDPHLEGLWKADLGDAPVYLDFRGSDMTMYQKSSGKEVLLAGFGCEYNGNEIKCTGNILGQGGIPYELDAKYNTSGDSLTIKFEGDEIIPELSGKIRFSRCNESDIKLFTADDATAGTTADEVYDSDYYGVFVASFKEREQCLDTLVKLEAADYRLCPVVYTPDFTELNQEPYYVVTAGLFSTKDRAEETLEDVKKAGFNDAYVKYAGKYKGDKLWYTLYGGNNIEVKDSRIIIHDADVTIPYSSDATPVRMDLVIDKDTDFDIDADLHFFGNSESGDTPYDWIARNHRMINEDPEKYVESGPALSGIFLVKLDGNRIARYYECYWWD